MGREVSVEVRFSADPAVFLAANPKASSLNRAASVHGGCSWSEREVQSVDSCNAVLRKSLESTVLFSGLWLRGGGF